MLSEMFMKLWESGEFTKAIWETIYMTLMATGFSYLFGLPLGIVLNVTSADGIKPIKWLNTVLAATPYIARMVESSIKEVGAGVIEAAQAMGTPTFKIITKVLIPEAKPSLIVGAVISIVTILGYSAMASTIAAGGLGAIAIIYGHQRTNPDITWISCIIIVIIVQIIQTVGMRIAHKTDKRINK